MLNPLVVIFDDRKPGSMQPEWISLGFTREKLDPAGAVQPTALFKA